MANVLCQMCPPEAGHTRQGAVTAAGEDLVSLALAQPDALRHWPLTRWSDLLRQARMAALLPRIAQLVNERDTQGKSTFAAWWPAQVAPHLLAALRVCQAQHAEVRREAAFIQTALVGLGAPVLLLKGAAYVMAGLPAAAGRVFSDIDIMVPKSHIGLAESLLTAHGWVSSSTSAYDQRYYRQWMHEIPPMEHLLRHTVLDVHHTILPQTARLRPDARLFFEAAVPVSGSPGLFVMAPSDMVLHSMTHLFLNDELSHAQRDLSDLDLLLRHFGRDSSFWPDLLARAQRLDLQRPLFYGLRYASRLLHTPVPPETLQASAALGPGAVLLAVMDKLWTRVLRPNHVSARLPGTSAAAAALYLRGHWLRMPPVMLAKHLSVKALGLHKKTGQPTAAW